MVKVASDPAQVIVNHASFRVQLPSTARASSRVAAARSAVPRREPVVGTGAAARRKPVVWNGSSGPGDSAATGLLEAVRTSGIRHGEAPRGPEETGEATQAIPAYGADETRAFGAPGLAETQALSAAGGPGAPLLPRMRGSGSAFDEEGARYGGVPTGELPLVGDRPRTGGRKDNARHGYYPGRRLNLGVVLLPLRVFLGLISVYAGMGKLCDPVYFDGGERGSMVKWLTSLHPWALAEPLRDFALSHPVGAGLSVAFLQIIAGVLTILGLWQRLAAATGVALSAALLVTVTWRTVPAYDAPDFIYLAAWSPLVIAGAPVYSVDARLASGAWRALGPRATLAALRGRVLRRGSVLAFVVIGCTLLVGAMLGAAVRDADRITAPGPGEQPRNELPGSPFPRDSASRGPSPSPSAKPSSPAAAATTEPGAPASAPARSTDGEQGGTAERTPEQSEGGTSPGDTPQAPPAPPQQAPQQEAPSSTGGGGPASGSGGGTQGSAPADSAPQSGGSGEGDGGDDGSGGGQGLGGLFG
ncbi:DoxX family protein [Streptomyces sp. P6-2-1]|uniref:DoxX family protein n=1 Tax=Streptomyces sp. P6-2-1 TaxID=3422591 RepID=UPI003D36F121